MKITETLFHSPTVILLKETAKQASSEYSVLIPLFAALAGGLIVLIGQGIDRHYKQKKEEKDTLRDIYANCRKTEALLKNYYREFAHFRVASQYRWYCAIASTDPEKKKDYENQHMKYNNSARETRRLIEEMIADFIGQVRKFQSLKAVDSIIESKLESISNLEYEDARKYEISIKQPEILALTKNDQNELRDEYYKNLVHFKKINNTLQGLI